MEKIASFTVNHDTLPLGMFTSRMDDDIITYDIRMTLPNSGDYLDYDGIHTFEHLFATYARNSQWKKGVIYVGPMGCRTGFYLLLRDTVSPNEAIELTKQSLDFIAAYKGEIPGATEKECGNAAGHNLQSAKTMAQKMKEVLSHWTVTQLEYPE